MDKSIKNFSTENTKRDTALLNACWIGGVPAHYTREMHRRVGNRLGNKIFFLYLKKLRQSSDRNYEKGDFPSNCIFVDSSDWTSIWNILKTKLPQKVIIAGHYPRSILIGLLWARLHKRRIAYWSDTNILDVRRMTWIRKNVELIVKRNLFGWVDDFLYMGSRNRDFYELVVGQKRLRGRLFKLPYPALTYPTVEQNHAQSQNIHLLYVGRLIPNKCVDRLIQGLALLSVQIRGQVMLTVVGDGPERKKLELLVKRLKLSEQVTFLGLVPSNEIKDIYYQHDVFVLPSGYEPWGLVVNEALSAGLPVIAPYWVGAVADLVIDGFTGFVLEGNQPEIIVEAINRTLGFTKKDLSQMGAEGAKLVSSGGFNIDIATQRFVGYIGTSIF